jgi:hypothetical protein
MSDEQLRDAGLSGESLQAKLGPWRYFRTSASILLRTESADLGEQPHLEGAAPDHRPALPSAPPGGPPQAGRWKKAATWIVKALGAADILLGSFPQVKSIFKETKQGFETVTQHVAQR